MSIITTNQQKRQSTLDPIFLLFLSVLIVLLLFAVVTANRDYIVGSVQPSLDNAPAGLTLNSEVSFTNDQKYWSEYCETGWTSDSACDAIFARTQSCSASVDSAYCSAYESYLQELGN